MVQRRRRGRFHARRSNHSKRANSYKVVCSACGKEAVVQVPAPNDKKLLCMECFTKQRMPEEHVEPGRLDEEKSAAAAARAEPAPEA
jgi:CxxC-x17-CxxC domain-containing protein